MKNMTTITIAMTEEMLADVEEMAKEQQCTINEFIIDLIRQRKAQKIFRSLVAKGTATAKRKGLTPEDFGGPFED